MSTETELATRPVRRRIVCGIRRGALVGLYFVALCAFLGLTGLLAEPHLLSQPLTGGMAILAGFGLAGAVLLLGLPHVRTSLAAAGLGVLCSYPALAGLAGALAGWRPAIVLGMIVPALVVGATVGVRGQRAA